MSPDSLPPEVQRIDYASRWAQIVERRRAQMDAAYAASETSSGDYWARRAKNYRAALHQHIEDDPFLQRVLSVVGPKSAVLDVGAGTGRHTLALATHVREVTAVDPSPAMLGLLRDDLAAQGIANVRVVEAEWMQTDVEPCDVVICSHVLYPIADVVPFLRKLEASSRERVFIYLRADPLPTDMGLWPDFHGVPLQPQPVHMDLINVLAEAGIFADVEIVEHRFTWTFPNLDEAQAQVSNSVCLREDDVQVQTKLRRLLEERLVAWPGGRLGPEVGSARSAIVSWAPPTNR